MDLISLRYHLDAAMPFLLVLPYLAPPTVTLGVVCAFYTVTLGVYMSAQE